MLLQFHVLNHLSFPIKKKKLLLVLLAMNLLFLDISAQQTIARQSPKSKRFFEAIRSGRTDMIEQQLADGANVNDSYDGFSALMAVTLNGTTEQMKMLIDRGADVNFAAPNGTTALWLAVPDWDKTTLLVKRGANVQHLVQGYGILVKLTAIPGCLKVIRFLIDNGADPNNKAPYLLFNAGASGDTAILGTLIRYGLNVNDTLSSGDFPINGALFYRNPATVKMLVENGAGVNMPSKSSQLAAFNGFTPLMYAAVNNDKESFYYLLEHGSNPNLKNANGYTALMLLQQAEEDDPKMTLALLKHGADPATKTPDGKDALHFAMQKGNTESVTLLKDYPAK